MKNKYQIKKFNENIFIIVEIEDKFNFEKNNCVESIEERSMDMTNQR